MAVKTYSLKKNGETYLSDHFQVKEFASIGQGKTYSDKVLIDTALVSLLEKVHKHFNCKAIVISSGYRTSEHDIAVGGSGSGYHVKGQAADFCCYDKSGKEIESSKVVLYLEDIGCNGIGYKCGGSSVYTHADTRAASARWYGDESRDFLDISQLGGYKSFYNYLGVKKSANTSTSTSSAAKTMKISTDGVNLIKSFEGLSLKACKALPTEEYYTIGYGHYGADVKAGQTITEAGAVKLLKKDLESFVSCVNKALTVKVTQKQFDALVSLCYNIGVGAFASSDLVTYLNKGKLYDAAAEITLWRKSGGSVIIGLQNRRIKEFRLFLTGKSLTLLCDMNVRAKPMTSSKRVKVLKKGKKIKVVDVAVSYSEYINIWLQTADGWVCGQLNGEVYLT